MDLRDVLKEFDAGKMGVSNVAKEMVRFFQKQLDDSEKVPKEKREEHAQKLVESFQQLIQLLNPYIQAIGLSEETLLKSFENPDYFDRDEWLAVMDAKTELSDLANRLLPFVAQTSPEKVPEGLPAKKDQRKPPPKTKWMKM